MAAATAWPIPRPEACDPVALAPLLVFEVVGVLVVVAVPLGGVELLVAVAVPP